MNPWTGNHWVVEQLTEKGKKVYVARNQRDGKIANEYRHETRERAQRQADILNAFWGNGSDVDDRRKNHAKRL